MLSNNNNVSQRDSPVTSPMGSQFDLDDIGEEEIVYYASQTPSQVRSPPPNFSEVEDLPDDTVMQIAQSIDLAPAVESDKKRRMDTPPQKFEEDALVQQFSRLDVGHAKIGTLVVDHIICTNTAQVSVVINAFVNRKKGN